MHLTYLRKEFCSWEGEEVFEAILALSFVSR